jgi:reductive dehalogenase
MKGLGLGAAGLGAVAAVSPVFHDIDEVVAAPTGMMKRPWYVKELDYKQITSGVDWGLMEQFSEVNTMRGSGNSYYDTLISKAERDALKAAGDATKAEWLAAGKSGYSTRDAAMSGSAASVSVSNIWNNDKDARGRDVSLPATKWTGTPEEATRMIQTAGRMFGCLSVGVMEIDADTKKLLYSWEPGGREQLTWEGNEPVETSSEHRHPVNAKYVISITDQESQELWKRNPTSLMTQIRYERASQIQFRFQTFLRKLGYVCLSEGGNGTGIAGAIAVMAGQGETGRHNRLITPEYGPTVGVFRYVTDLPLAPTKPIDSGLWEFCKACKKCAEACGGDAIPYGDPTWDITENTTPWLEGAAPVDRPGAYKDALGNPELRQGGWHAVGHEQYPEDSRKCRLWKMSAGTCRSGRCLAVCTFTKYNEAGIHEVVKGITATTSVFNGFFRTLDDAFGYGLRGRRHDDFSDNETADQAQADWWNLDLPIYGIDSTIGAGRIS